MSTKQSYSTLQSGYTEMLELFDTIHFNSSVTKSVYLEHLDIDDSVVIPVTHSHLVDSRVKREFSDDKELNIMFIGNTTHYKGFPMLEKILSGLNDNSVTNWKAQIWGANGVSSCKNICFNGKYAPKQLGEIYAEDSLLVVPSLWNETFSLVTLEALSYGIPVLVSSRVGAKDIVASYDKWFVFDTPVQLKDKIAELIADRSRLRSFNNSIITQEWCHSIESHCNEIINIYHKK
ncbi:MAG: glycosyltransferase family 4 protein [Rikenellaceae bacterium]